MPTNVMSLTSDLLGHITNGGNAREIERLLSELQEVSNGTEEQSMVAYLQSQLSTLTRQRQEAGLTERGLRLLIDSTHDLLSTLSLEELWQKIGRRARELVGSDISWLARLDSDAKHYRTITMEGNLLPSTAKQSLSMDFGMANIISQSKCYFTTQNYLTDNRFAHSQETDRNFSGEKIVSVAGFPVLSKDRVQGILFVADRSRRPLSGQEISVLGSFALHAGVAIQNAQTFERLSQALKETERNRVSLENQIERVEASARIHDETMMLLAQGADLLTYMQRMAGQIDGAVQYVNNALEIREDVVGQGYCGRLNKEMRSGSINRATVLSAIAQSRRNGRFALVVETEKERCLALAIHDRDTQGDGLIIYHTGQIDEIHMRNLERSTIALSIAKLWTEKRESERLISSSTLLRHLSLVSQPDEPTIAAVRSRLNLGTREPVRIVLIIVSGVARSEQTELIRSACARNGVLVNLVDDAYLAVGSSRRIDKLVTELQRRSGREQIGGLLSRVYYDLTETPRQYERIAKALRTMQRITSLNSFVQEEEIGLFPRLFEGADAQRIAEFVTNTLSPITSRDPHQRAQLKATLLCFFDCQFSISQTAEKLGIHVNTVRQRLETLRGVTGGWDDPISALELHVALRLDALNKAL